MNQTINQSQIDQGQQQNIKKTIKLFTFDIETTSVVRDDHHKIIQFAWQKSENGIASADGLIYLQIDFEIPQVIKELTKIDNARLDQLGINHRQGLKAIVQLLNESVKDGYYLAGHNIVGFDIFYIFEQADRYIHDDPNYIELMQAFLNHEIKWFDSLINARKEVNADHYEAGFKNAQLATKYGISFDPEQLHDAKVDVELSAKNLWHQAKRLL